MRKNRTKGPVTLSAPSAEEHANLLRGLMALQAEHNVRHWSPWVQAKAKATKSVEAYTVILPGRGRFSVEIPNGADRVTARTSSDYMYHEEVISAPEARYRFLRAYFGSQFESGRMSRDTYLEVSLRLEQAAGQLFKS